MAAIHPGMAARLETENPAFVSGFNSQEGLIVMKLRGLRYRPTAGS